MSCGPEPADNLAKALDRVSEAARKGAHVVCLPELFQTQYFCQREDAALFDLAEPIPGPVTETLAAAALKNKIVLIALLFGSFNDCLDLGLVNFAGRHAGG